MLRENLAITLAGLSVCVFATATHAQQVNIFDVPPLQKTEKEEVLVKGSAGYRNRQYREKFPLAEKLGAAGWFSVNLKPHCNMNLFSDEGRTCPVKFHQMKLGRQEFYGVPFEIIAPSANANRTAIALPSTMLLKAELPASVEVPIGKVAAVLYFLSATYYTTPQGEQFFRINYEDGTGHKIPFVGTKHTGDWFHQNTAIYTEDVHYVLVPSSKGSETHFRNMHILQWKNPSPAKKIKSVTFKSDPEAQMAILVVAVTGHPGGR